MPAAACKRAVQLLTSAEVGGSKHVAKKLYEEGLTSGKVAPHTVIRNAKRHAAEHGDKLVCLRGRPPKVMTAATREKRLQFAHTNRLLNWKNVMITDRCRFYFRYPGSCVTRTRWCLRSMQHAEGVFTPNKPACYNVYGGITRFGVTKLHSVTGTSKKKTKFKNQQGQDARNITKGEYREVLSETLLKEGRRIFSGQGMAGFVLQQDNDPCHGVAQSEIAKWNDRRGSGVVRLLENWPGNSPDLSPIENVWSWVDSEVAQMGCRTFEDFCRAVDRTFSKIPISMLENLFDSIPKRLQDCISCDGHRTGY